MKGQESYNNHTSSRDHRPSGPQTSHVSFIYNNNCSHWQSTVVSRHSKYVHGFFHLVVTVTTEAVIYSPNIYKVDNKTAASASRTTVKKTVSPKTTHEKKTSLDASTIRKIKKQGIRSNEIFPSVDIRSRCYSVAKINENEYKVKRETEHTVLEYDGHFWCDCKDFSIYQIKKGARI